MAALPKNIVSDAKAQLASAKQITSSAKAAIAAAPKAVVKTVVAAAKVVKPPPALKDQLDPLSRKLLDSVPGAKIVVSKQGKVSVSTPAAATSAAALFKPAATAAKPVVVSQKVQPLAVSGFISKPSPASATITIKPPAASSKPPAMTQNRPPAPAASVGASIPATASSAVPPMLKPPPVAAADAAASSAPALEGYLVRLNGTIAPRGRYRAA